MNKAFERWWPDLEAKIDKIPKAEDGAEPPKLPEVPAMFFDIMASLRGLKSNMHYVSQLVDRPQTGRVSGEYQAMADIMSHDDGLRQAIAYGDRQALSFARDKARKQMAARQRHARDLRNAREEFGLPEPIVPEVGDDALDEDPALTKD